MNQILEQLPRTAEVIVEGIERGLHLGVQVYVSQHGQVLVNDACGLARAEEELTREHILPWLSSGKPVTAVVIARLVERGALTFDTPVTTVIPEFAVHGKSGITVRHLLTHTAGLERVVTGWPQRSWREIIERICDAQLMPAWTPGARAAYDPASSWFILGEIARRLDGRSIEQIVREDIFRPLGVEAAMAWSREEYDAQATRVAPLYSMVEGQLRPTHGHSFEVSSRASPGGSMRGPGAALGRFYESLLSTRQDVSNGPALGLLSPQTARLLTSRWREGMHDETFQHKVDFGGGVIVDSNHHGARTVPYGFGERCSSQAFGHGGAQSSIGFADPQHGLVVVAIANGCPGEVQHNRRFRQLNTAIYTDLGIA